MQIFVQVISFYIPIKNSIGSYMSSTGAICKDDENGDARVFVTNGSPPFEYNGLMK